MDVGQMLDYGYRLNTLAEHITRGGADIILYPYRVCQTESAFFFLSFFFFFLFNVEKKIRFLVSVVTKDRQDRHQLLACPLCLSILRTCSFEYDLVSRSVCLVEKLDRRFDEVAFSGKIRILKS